MAPKLDGLIVWYDPFIHGNRKLRLARAAAARFIPALHHHARTTPASAASPPFFMPLVLVVIGVGLILYYFSLQGEACA